MLLLLGPWVDAWVSGHWVGDYTMTTPALGVLLLSCAFSVGVNVSQFMCLGRFSAATFQVGAALLNLCSQREPVHVPGEVLSSNISGAGWFEQQTVLGVRPQACTSPATPGVALVATHC
jgi:hypothetical protein